MTPLPPRPFPFPFPHNEQGWLLMLWLFPVASALLAVL